MPQIDWTLSLSDILAYAGFAAILAWRIGIRLTKLEATLDYHAKRLDDHSDRIALHSERFDKAMDKMSALANELQRLIGRSEIFWRTPRSGV